MTPARYLTASCLQFVCNLPAQTRIRRRLQDKGPHTREPSGRADARIRTADPFITREVRRRERRVSASFRGHVSPGRSDTSGRGLTQPWTLVDALMYPCRTLSATARGCSNLIVG